MTTMGFDVARGGKDKTVFAKRYGVWLDELVKYEGRETPDGPTAAALADMELGEDEKDTQINIDIIGYGSSAYDSLRGWGMRVSPINFASGSSMTDKTGKYLMRNLRAEAYWNLRELLDPNSGEEICLPPDNELLGDLAAVRYKVTAGGILMKDKDEIKKLLGRSPDCGDAVALAFLSSGLMFKGI